MGLNYKDYVKELKDKCDAFIKEVELNRNENAYTDSMLEDIFESVNRLKDFYEKTETANKYEVTVVRSMDALKEYLEEKGWHVEECSFGPGGKVYGWDISQYSPAGEDFSFSIVHDGDVKHAIRQIQEIAFEFDVDEHVEMWVQARGNVSGVPDTVTLVEDAKDIQEMLDELADGVSYYEVKTIGEIVAEIKQRSEETVSGSSDKDDLDFEM